MEKKIFLKIGFLTVLKVFLLFFFILFFFLFFHFSNGNLMDLKSFFFLYYFSFIFTTPLIHYYGKTSYHKWDMSLAGNV